MLYINLDYMSYVSISTEKGEREEKKRGVYFLSEPELLGWLNFNGYWENVLGSQSGQHATDNITYLVSIGL